MNMHDCFVKCANLFVSIFNAVFLWIMFFVVSCCIYTTRTWGTVSLPQLLFFVQSGVSDGVELKLMIEVIGWCVVLPIVATGVLLFCFNKYKKEGVLFFNRIFFFIYLVILWLLANCLINLDDRDKSIFYIILFVFYVLNQWRSFNRLAVSFMLFLTLPVVYVIISFLGSERLILSCFDFEESNFYEQEYVYVDKLDIKEKRNVIIIFGESMEISGLSDKTGKLMVKDNDAIKFSDFTEGYSQRWTQGALFSAFTGTHIHYLSDFYRYALFDKLKYDEKNDRILMISNYVGQDFDFNTPNIRYLGDISKENGYKNIFVQGADLSFSGTEKFLFRHGFNRSDVYGLNDFMQTPEYEKGKYWWGVNDKLVFDLFKSKISELDGKQPFLAVMFTLDLHRGENPFYKNDADIKKATAENLNGFIEWFKKQDFYQNTTLVVLADHKRMGENVAVGGGLYNAFFNLPKRLEDKIEKDRRFEQIDVFPTILKIMGAELPLEKAGVGTSLFSNKKTIAERLTYEKQENVFSKIDKHYQKLWNTKELFKQSKPKDMFIAHAGGTIDGHIYTNSLEAMEASVKRGYKYIELDLITIGTPPYKLIATHDCMSLCQMLGKEAFCDLDSIDVEKSRLLEKYTLLDDTKILDFFLKYKDLWLVTDKVDEINLLNEKFSKLKNRMIVEVFSLKKYKEAKKFGFAGVAYNVDSIEDIDVVIDNDISMVTMSLNWSEYNKKSLKKLKENGVKILGYSAKTFDKVRLNKKEIDMFYYDGEENLVEFWRDLKN